MDFGKSHGGGHHHGGGGHHHGGGGGRRGGGWGWGPGYVETLVVPDYCFIDQYGATICPADVVDSINPNMAGFPDLTHKIMGIPLWGLLAAGAGAFLYFRK